MAGRRPFLPYRPLNAKRSCRTPAAKPIHISVSRRRRDRSATHTVDDMQSDDLRDHPARRKWRPWVTYPIVTVLGLVELLLIVVVVAAAMYTPEYVIRVLRYQQSDQQDYLHHFPLRELTASPMPYEYPIEADDERVLEALASGLAPFVDGDHPDIDRVDAVEAFLADTGTQAMIVIQDGSIVYEEYYAGAERDTMLTSFSVAKSFDSALVGIAIDEGLIGSVDDPITDYLPELAQRDDRFTRITIRDVLMMSSGLDYSANRWALFNGDDALTTYYTDQRELVLEHIEVERGPGERFSYNKYHPQILGLILERATGTSVTEFMQTRLWDPLGMQYSGAWALDSDGGFEKMEAGLNARAIDFAKLGSLYLNRGALDGRRIVSADWVDASTHPDTSRTGPGYYGDGFGSDVYANGDGSYQMMWYCRLRGEDPPDFAAEGDHGQFIYVSPAYDTVIVRLGTSYGLPSAHWMTAFHRTVEHL